MIIAKTEIDAKRNVEEGTFTTFDVPELICESFCIELYLAKPHETKGMRFTPEPRKVGSPFWYYVVKKIRAEENRTGSTAALIRLFVEIPEGSFLDKYLQKWPLLSDERISVRIFMVCEYRNIRGRHRRRRSVI